jgi:FKBP-type peptidyl-prolyl cis-trans isomerase SlyD
MRVENVDGVFDTTDRDRASESGIYDPKHEYGPIVAIVGAGHLVPGLEKALQEKGKKGEWVEIELAPEEAFGPRDPKKIETVPMQRFKQSKVEPRVGERIQYKNRPATITRAAGGRVWVDTNSPLAGRKVTYKFCVEEVLEDEKDRVAAILEHAYRRGIDFGVEVKGSTADIVVPDQVKYDRNWTLVKFRVAHELGSHTGIEKVRFIEEHTTKPPEAAESAGAATAPQDAPASPGKTEGAGAAEKAAEEETAASAKSS